MPSQKSSRFTDKEWAKIAVSIVSEADYDIGKQYDKKTAEDPRDVEHYTRRLVRAAKEAEDSL